MLILITIGGGLLAAYLLATLVLTYLVHQIPRQSITDPPDWGTVTDVRIPTVENGWLEIDTVEDYETANTMFKDGTIRRFFDPVADEAKV